MYGRKLNMVQQIVRDNKPKWMAKTYPRAVRVQLEIPIVPVV
jgi:hypothetical protein